jgi:hypothetical protein
MPVKPLLSKSIHGAMIVVERKFLHPRRSTGGYNHPAELGLWKRFHPKVLSKDINTCTICDKNHWKLDNDICMKYNTNVELKLAVVVAEVLTLEERR